MITWSIAEIKADADSGGVLNVCVTYSGANGDKQDTRSDWLTFFPDPSSETFVPFAELTENVVLNWVFEKKGVDWKAQKEQELKDYLGLSQPVNITTQIPWKA